MTSPRLSERVLSWCLPADDRQAVLGDLAEEFSVRVTRDGASAARGWYRRQVRRSVVPALARRFGDRLSPRRAVRGWRPFGSVRVALRVLRESPLASLAIVVSLALGIGANTAVFSVVDSLMLRMLPVREPAQLVQLFVRGLRSSWTNPQWELIRDRHDLFDGACASAYTQFDLSNGGSVDPAMGIRMSGGCFDVLGVTPAVGRLLQPGDDNSRGGGETAVAVLSYDFWQRRFAGAPDVVGRTIMLDRTPFTVVGVSARGFTGIRVGTSFDVAVPIASTALTLAGTQMLDDRTTWWLAIMARLRAGDTPESALARLRGIQPQIRRATMPPDYRPQEAATYLKPPFDLAPASTGFSGLRQKYGTALQVLMAVVGLVLLVACVNIANLLLAQASARRHDASVRLALGATRGRLVRQSLTEAGVLSAAGTLLGLALAAWGSRFLVHEISATTGGIFLDLALSARVLAFTAAVAIATTLVFGLAPAWRLSRVDPIEALNARGRGLSPDRRWATSATLVSVQVGVSLVLLVASGLFVHSFVDLVSSPTGWNRDGVLLVQVTTQGAPESVEARPALYERIRTAIRGLPGVTHAGFAAMNPLGGEWDSLVENPDGLALPERDRDVFINAVNADWFPAMGIPLHSGDLAPLDAREGYNIAVNEALVRRFFPGGNPIGRRLRQVGTPNDPGTEWTIVAVVADAAYDSLTDPVPPTWYEPVAFAENRRALTLNIRAAGGTDALSRRALVDAIGGVESRVGLSVTTLDSLVRSATTQARALATLSGFFGGLAMLLSAVGLYGVTAQDVLRRRREMGIRLALGASPRLVRQLVVGRAARLVIAGAAVGALASLWATRFVSSLLVGVTARDPATVAGAAVLVGAIALAAAWLPARRASTLDPSAVLRDS